MRRAATSGLAAAVLVLALWPAHAALAAPDTDAARATVQETLDEVLVALRKPDASYDERRSQIEAIAFPRFDFETISRLVLGRNWKTLDAKQQAEFIEEFKRHLTLSYGRTIDDYKDHEFSVVKARAERNDDVTVRTEIDADSAVPYLIDYRMRLSGDRWRVIDVVVEGISLVQNFRDQTRTILRDVGPDGLIERLREKNQEREQG